MTSRILVTGSRDWPNIRIDVIQYGLYVAWDLVGKSDDTVLVSGNCKTGADLMAETVWLSQGMEVEVHPAIWRINGKLNRRAGLDRNQKMVDLGADVCVAFQCDGSTGTAHCYNAARKAGIPVMLYKTEGPLGKDIDYHEWK